MSIYKRNNRMDYERGDSFREGEKRGQKGKDYVEYTNMSSYERYLKNKESGKYREAESNRTYAPRYDERDYRSVYGYRNEYDRPPYESERAAYDRRDYYDYPRRYDEQYDNRTEDYRAYEYERPKARKSKKAPLCLKAKIMIGVYILIVACIVALIIVNVIPSVKAENHEQAPEEVVFENPSEFLTQDGSEIKKVESVIKDNDNE